MKDTVLTAQSLGDIDRGTLLSVKLVINGSLEPALRGHRLGYMLG